MQKITSTLAVFILFVFLVSDFNNEVFSQFYRLGENNSKEEEEGGIPKKDKMDLAWQQEFEITHDPKTGTVPKERLLEAWRYKESLLKKNALGKAAIAGVNWVERGPNNSGGRTRGIWIDLNDTSRKTVWLGSAGGGLWKTTDISQTAPNWTPINDFFQCLAVTSISQAPSNTQIMYFGTGEGNGNADAVRGLGLWKSTNAGTSWTQLSATNNSTYYYCQKIFTLGNGDTLLVATRSGLWRSLNGGTSFSKVLGSGISSAGGDVAQDIERMSNGTLYATMSGSSSSSGTIHKSYNNGATWTSPLSMPNSNAREIEIAVSNNDTNVVWCLVENSNTIVAIWRSSNAGTSFSITSAYPADADSGIPTTDFSRGQAWYDLSIAADPNNSAVCVVGGVDLFKTTNSGASWSQLSHWYGGFGYQEVHADQHHAVFSPGSSSICYFTNDGGVFRSTNFNASSPTITEKSKNYRTLQFYACDINPTAGSNQFLAGSQDNGSHSFSTSGLGSTTEVTGGDGAFTHIDQNQQQYQFTSYVYNNYYRSTDGGATFNTALSNNNGSFINPTDYDDANNTMYCGYTSNNYMFWSNPQTGSTTAVKACSDFNGTVTHVRVSPNVNNRTYFGTSSARIVKMDSANSTTYVSSIINSGTSMSGSISCIDIEAGNENHIIATLSNYGVISVWETSNGGSSWTSKEGNLPDMPVRWVVFNPNSATQAMIATELGVWSTNNLAATTVDWQPSNSGLSNVRTDMLKIRASDKVTLAATHGRGLFSSNVFSPPSADFAVNKTITYQKDTLQFTDYSNAATSWSWDFGDGTTSTLQNPRKVYTSIGTFSVTLSINSSTYSKTYSNLINALPAKGTPYNLSDGGNFDVNATDFLAINVNPSGTAFARGSSSVTAKSGTSTGSFSWVTGLTGNYLDNSNAYLYSPSFNMLNTGTYTLKIKAKNSFEIGYDGWIVEYSLNNGNTWQQLGTATQTSWYDYVTSGATAFNTSQPFFNATRATFTQMQFNISSLAGNNKVCFRFQFKSDANTTSAGLALDDFELLGPSNASMPVNLTMFSGKRIYENQVQIIWQTANEVNNKGFEIWRMKHQENIFEKIAFVKGNGNTQVKNNYQFLDENSSNKWTYYKLEQIDYDGTKSSSHTILVAGNENATDLNVYTVFNQRGFTYSGNMQHKIELINLNGELTKTIENLEPYILIPCDDMKQGIYIIRFTDLAGKTTCKKVYLN